ncbi:MAG: TonB-dependent receptor [Candidatus Pelagadaptatus aseana]|uniref:TonB-dependent receptor n=1 Tax=Candidatus Pelagadaptatus aseana TaxID=3120508 RepID=UPI0039B2A59A
MNNPRQGKTPFLQTLGRLPLAMAIAMATSQVTLAQSSGHSLTLEEVVVTAQKREQNSMDVPIAVDTFSTQNMENTGALVLEDMDDYVPGFEVSGGATQSTLSIRGVSSSNISSGGDPSVATFFDGVYIPSTATTIAFSDMARVEVLKGPQGTLSGKNAAVGSVNMVPNGPSLEGDEGFIKLKAGNYDFMRWEGMFNTVLSEDVALRVNLLTNQRDSYLDNGSAVGEELDTQDNITARVAVLWNISDVTDLTVSADYDKTDNGAQSSNGYVYATDTWVADPFSDDASNDVVGSEETRDMYSVGFKLNHELNDNWAMSWWANYRDLDTTNLDDQDGTGITSAYLHTDNIESNEIFYTELQFNYEGDGISFVGGMNYSTEDKTQTTTIVTTTETAAALATQVANGFLIDSGLNALIPGDGQLDSIWSTSDWNDFVGALIAGTAYAGPADGSPADYQAALAQIIGAAGGLGAGLAPYESVLAATWAHPSAAGGFWNEQVDNTADFTSWGIYGDIDFTITDRLNLIFGLRYSEDEKDFSWFSPLAPQATILNAEREAILGAGAVGTVVPNATNILSPLSQGSTVVTDTKVSASDKWSKTTGRAVAQYQLTDELMTFLSYSTGYKSGGFDSLDLDTATDSIDPEEVENIEIGIKGDLLDGKLRMQLSYFDMEVEGKQRSVTSYDPTYPGIAGVPQIVSSDDAFDGWELSLNWLPTDNLMLGLITTQRDSESTSESYFDAQGNPQGGTTEKGETLDAYTLTLDWTPEIPVGSLHVHMDYIFNEQDLQNEDNYQVGMESGIENFGDDKEILNARIAWYSDDDKYELALWGKNLLDNQYTGVPGGYAAGEFGIGLTTISEPLTWGMDARYNF